MTALPEGFSAVPDTGCSPGGVAGAEVVWGGCGGTAGIVVVSGAWVTSVVPVPGAAGGVALPSTTPGAVFDGAGEGGEVVICCCVEPGACGVGVGVVSVGA